MLDAGVADGSLPPVEQRLPPEPLVITPVSEVGSYGGTARAMRSSTEEFGDATSVVGIESLTRLNAEDGATIEPNLAQSLGVVERRQDPHHDAPQGAEMVRRRALHHRRHRLLVG